ncbi:PAS domain-containing protein [Rubricoccus marinus]|nr:PAS domain-containing protein [Rubricoccus marinus]
MNDSSSATRLHQNDGFQLIAQALPDAVFVVNADGFITYVGDKVEPMLGHAPEDILGKAFRELIHEGDRSGLPHRFSEVQGGAWDARFLNPNGVPMWTNVSVLAPTANGVLDTGDMIVLVRGIRENELPRDRTMLYRRALDASNNLIVVTDPCLPDNPIVFVNSFFLEATGYEREEIVGQNCRFLQIGPDGVRDDYQPGFDGKPGLDALREAIATGSDITVVLRNYRKSGEMFYNELFLTAVLDENGEALAFVGVQNDITARIEAQSTLEDREKELGAFYNRAELRMGILEVDGEQLVHRSANRAACELFGVKEVDGATSKDLGFTDAETRRWYEHVRTFRSGDDVAFETRFPWDASSEDPGATHFRVLISPIGDGPLFAYVMEDQTSTRALEAERRRLYAAVESLRDPVMITDATLNRPGPYVLYVNPAYTSVFGYEAEEVIGKTPRISQGAATDHSVLARMRRKLEAGKPASGEVINYKKDGTPFLLQWEVAAVKDETGRVVHFVATMRDVTDRRRLERAVLEATAREQERMARDLHDGLGQVLAGTRYALSAVAGSLTQEDHREASTVRAAADQIGVALNQARTIAHGLLPTHLENNDLPTAIAELARDVSQAYSVVCSFEGGLTVTPASHSHHLYRIAQEAATNAVRHGGAHRIDIRLEALEAHPSGFGASLTIVDDGCGIDAGSASSNGLGMRSMHFRAQSIGGELRVESAPGERGTQIVCLFDAETSQTAGSADREAVMGID